MTRTRAQQQSFELQQARAEAIVETEKRLRGEIERQGRVIVHLLRENQELKERDGGNQAQKESP